MLNNIEFLAITEKVDNINDIVDKMNKVSNAINFIDKQLNSECDISIDVAISATHTSNNAYNSSVFNNTYKTIEQNKFLEIYRLYLNNMYDDLKAKLDPLLITPTQQSSSSSI